MTRNQKLVAVGVVIGLLLLTCVGGFAVSTFLSRSNPSDVASGSAPVVLIKSPAAGAVVPLNSEVSVQVSATDNAGIVRVELWVNGLLLSSESSPTAQSLTSFSPTFKWRPTSAGTYNLEARAVNRNNVTGSSTTIQITAQADATPVPTPAATTVSAPAPPTATNTPVPAAPTNTPLPPTTNTPTKTPAPPTPTPTKTPIPFLVTSATAGVSPGSSSACPTTFNFSAVISTNGPGAVTYMWERSDSAIAPNQSITFSGAGSQTVATTWTLSGSYKGWERVRIITPNALVSNQANFTLVCTYRTGTLNIPQTFSADLDAGTVSSGANSDIWFEAVTATERYVTPRNGAQIAIHGTSAPSFFDCQSEALSANRININDLSVGTYVCVRTSAGRYAEFRVNAPAVGPSPGTLHIGFTTWR